MIRRLPSLTVSTLALCAGLVLLTTGDAPAFERPPAQQGTDLPDCAGKLERQNGGWCEIRPAEGSASIASVWPKDLDQKTYMTVGPRAVLLAWNGAAFDEENLLLYFMGGGHGDYGGNEVYEFDLKQGRWSRLTDPSPLDFLYRFRKATATRPALLCWAPDLRRVPGSAHTYDGLQFSRRTGTVFYVDMGAANGSCFEDGEGRYENDPRVISNASGIFEFNPSRQESRHGLEPLTWRRVAIRGGVRLAYPRSLELPDGNFVLGSRYELYRFDPETGDVGKRLGAAEDFGDGLAEFYPPSSILSLHQDYLNSSTLAGWGIRRLPAPPSNGKSLAVDKHGLVFSWNGISTVLTLDPQKPGATWQIYGWAGAGPAKGDHRVYSKWQYVQQYDVFVGLSTHETGVWVYKHPPDMPSSASGN